MQLRYDSCLAERALVLVERRSTWAVGAYQSPINEWQDVGEVAMDQNVKDEFDIDAFAQYYEALSDTFIDIRKAAASLKKLIPKASQIFEIGLGTGYFAEQFLKDGYTVCGIQPPDQMLTRLRKERPNVFIKAEARLEDYAFDDQYDVIVSHSSVFLFTRLEALSGPHGEIDESLVFQSFIGNKLLMVSNLVKVLLALSPGGKFFINVQTNPLPLAEVGPPEDRFKFEMTRCVYNLVTERVEKMFRATYQAKSYIMPEIHYCSRYSDFKRYVELIGGTVELAEDGQWVILERVQ